MSTQPAPPSYPGGFNPGGANRAANPWWDFITNRSNYATNKVGSATPTTWETQAGVNFLAPFSGAVGPASHFAYGNLMDILTSQGMPNINPTLSGIQRDTQSQQQVAQGYSARQGFSNSGVASAIQAALGQAGVSKQADVRQAAAASAADRKRSDLDLFYKLILGPATDFTALAQQQYQARQQADAAKNAQKSQFLATLAQFIGGS